MDKLRALHKNGEGIRKRACSSTPKCDDANRKFDDCHKSVDFVLVRSAGKEMNEGENVVINIKTEEKSMDEILEADESKPENKREIFENNLRKEGLDLEHETANGGLIFVKIHAPRPVLRKYCEILKLRMPMKVTTEEKEEIEGESNFISFVRKACSRGIRSFSKIDPGSLEGKAKERSVLLANERRRDEFSSIDPGSYGGKAKKRSVLLAEYSRDKFYLFDEDDENFFSSAVRSLVVDFILQRTAWTNDETDMDSVGIQRLIPDVYEAAYILHDGDYDESGSCRYELLEEWGKMNKWIWLQPIDTIKDYLGVQCAFYFAWLEFYTKFLIPAAICGLAVFIYGISTLPFSHVGEDVCNKTNVTMCPLCDQKCDYWQLSDACLYSKIGYLFDNNSTVVFAFFMSVWATLFLEVWKRRMAVLAHRWGMANYTLQAEHPRPEFLAQLSNSKNVRVNVVTGLKEPYLPFWTKKLPTRLFSYSIIFIFMMIAVAAVFGVALYRIAVTAAFNALNKTSWLHQYGETLIPTTAAILNLICIVLLNGVYDKIAVFLTEKEMHRTQAGYDKSLSIKIYIFQFVNYYASIFYLAFLKGKNVGHPSEYTRIFGQRNEECGPSGCMMELTIQMAVIMTGHQFIGTIQEMFAPWWSWFQKYTINKKLVADEDDPKNEEVRKPWMKDFNLLDWGPQLLFSEYLEMVMQFGFVTLFVSAFPLAPLFALLNNIFEIRLDAQKVLKFYRRPVPYRARDIGIWHRILNFLGILAVICNAVIIAFSSSFVPRLVHSYVDGEKDYFGQTMSKFDTAHFPDISRPLYPSNNVSSCSYMDYREPPGGENQYERTSLYWQILVARLLFVILFQNAVFTVKVAMYWFISDVPSKLDDDIKKESYLTMQLIIKKETEMVKQPNKRNNNKKSARAI